MIRCHHLHALFQGVVVLVPRFFLVLDRFQPFAPPKSITSTKPRAFVISSRKINFNASTEKYSAKIVPIIVNGNPKENKLSCGADLVINPMPKFTKNNKLTIGNAMRMASS